MTTEQVVISTAALNIPVPGVRFVHNDNDKNNYHARAANSKKKKKPRHVRVPGVGGG